MLKMKKNNMKNNDIKGGDLIRIGGVAALICAAMYVITLLIYVPAYRAGSSPSTVLEWLALFQTKPLTGLFFLGLADVVILILWIPMVMALHVVLKTADGAWAKIATALVFVGVAVYLATNTAFSMLSLSREYGLATTEVQQATIQAAGQSLIAVSQGTGGQYAGMPLAWLGGLILSIVMLCGKAFSKTNAWAGILGMGLLIASIPFAGYTTTGTTTIFVDAVIAITYIGGGLLSLVWYILTGLKLLRIGRIK
jgi:hypothetical protein